MEHVSCRPLVWAGFEGRCQDNRGIVESLDVSILQDLLLDPILGIKDVRTDKRIDCGRNPRDGRTGKIVNEGQAVVAFSLYPTNHRRSLESV